MTCWQAMHKLEQMGYTFIQNGDTIKAAIIGTAPPEASALLEIVRADRAAAADYIRQRAEGATVTDDGCTYPLLDALAIGQAVRKGDAVLIGKVIFHAEPVTISICWHPVCGDSEAVLEYHRERLKSSLERRLQVMEQQPIDGMTEAEMDGLIDQYMRYKTILATHDKS